MFLSKLKMAAAAVVFITIASGSTAWACHRFRGRPVRLAAAPPVCVAEMPQVAAVPPTEPEPIPAPPKLPRVKEVLQEHEKRMRAIESCWCPNLTRTETEKDGTVRVFKGEFRFLRPEYIALFLKRTDNPSQYELYVTSAHFFYEYRPQQKLLRIHDRPSLPEGTKPTSHPDWRMRMFDQFLLSVDDLFPMLLNVDADRNSELYEITMVKESGGYIYLTVLPKNRRDNWLLTQAQLVIHTESFLPRRFWALLTNGKQVTWDFDKLDAKIKLEPKDFMPPAVPQDWQKDRLRWHGDGFKEKPSPILK